eukprot:CAMPEP_0204246300 /NCGR_PEP_ID=MMETSP0361-20130328/98066_1 /ASSEMBLY_ACC=CAM_ASM_000343 /TAXON_ID=268821 /ORGANISM="Scrippsiella Hangoei, Strain SHTV-5" /LENGTH=239 /DNA_ID=CAMNT_0051219517 /DNA_START=3513 /DNA_END=4229 /DNA_ORIENTATION=-
MPTATSLASAPRLWASSKINAPHAVLETVVLVLLPLLGLVLLLPDVVEVLPSSSPREDSAPSRTLCTQHPDPRGFLSDVLVDLLATPGSTLAAVDLAARTLHSSSVTMPLSSRSLIWPPSLRSPLAASAPMAKPRHDRTTSSSGASRPSRPAASTAAGAPWCLRRRLGPVLPLCVGTPRGVQDCTRLVDFTVDLAMTFTAVGARRCSPAWRSHSPSRCPRRCQRSSAGCARSAHVVTQL